MDYSNPDLAVVAPAKRTWSAWNYAALWVSLSLCIPTYMLAGSLIEGGMDWRQAMLTVFAGNLIVLVPMLLNGHAGARYGIPFPVLVRASFGIRGANVPALLRAIVACGWFGIQTWIGANAVYHLVSVWLPGFAHLPPILPAWVGLTSGQAIAFAAFWALNMLIVHYGIDSIRRLLSVKAILLPTAAIILLVWALAAAKGLGPILSRPSTFETSAQFREFFFPALTGMVGFWATLSLNIPDFTRYAQSQRAQVLGQTIALPLAMTAFSFVGVVVTSATAIVYGSVIWDPLALAARIESPVLVSLCLAAVIVATLATNIAANIVTPANDFSNLCPSRIDFRRGGYITGIVGVLIFPWKLVSDPSGFIYTWLVAYSALLGPIAGVMLADYFVVRRGRLAVDELYAREGRYWFAHGVNPKAMIALVLGIAPNLPGFFVAIHVLPQDAVPAGIVDLYHYAWFVGLAVSGVVYAAWSNAAPHPDPLPRAGARGQAPSPRAAGRGPG
jgi:NCS1 family nucleobase:cation symporter-1